MNDLNPCADLCEQHGFAAPAAVLRALATGPPPFTLVRAVMDAETAEYTGLAVEDVDPPHRKVFVDRARAEQYARNLTCQAIRNMRCTGDGGNPTALDDDQFCRAVGTILHTTYQLPTEAGRLLFPPEATEAEVERLRGLLELSLFEAVPFTAESHYDS